MIAKGVVCKLQAELVVETLGPVDDGDGVLLDVPFVVKARLLHDACSHAGISANGLCHDFR